MSTTGAATEVAANLRDAFRGSLITPDDAGYDEARALYNGMIDKRPALIARCHDVADVIAMVNAARESGIRLAVRGGGHHAAGLSSVDDGLCLDLSPMRAVRVDPDTAAVRVEGGATIADIDHATSAFGLSVPLGTVSMTGVAGLTLGGGVGYLTRRYGLTIDSLAEADVVLADGRLVTASEHENADLFWALRGGGGNFGVVTSFLFRGQPTSDVIGGPMFWPVEEAPEVMALYRDVMAAAPDDLYGFFLFATVPPVDPFPPALQLKKVCGVVWCWTGAPEEADAQLAAMRALPPALDAVGPMTVAGLDSLFDPLLPKGLQWYWRTEYLDGMPDELIAKEVEFGSGTPSVLSTSHIYPCDAAAGRVSRDATAWVNRDARWVQVIIGIDPDPTLAGALREWAVGFSEAIRPYAMGGSYVNMTNDTGDEAVRAAYRDHYDRLAAIKAKYDPANLFSVNQNIRPAPAAA
jgi:FAD/FMN-containing dehydrogenase